MSSARRWTSPAGSAGTTSSGPGPAAGRRGRRSRQAASGGLAPSRPTGSVVPELHPEKLRPTMSHQGATRGPPARPRRRRSFNRDIFMINRFATAAGFAAVLISAGIASAEPFSGAYAGVALSSDSFEARAEDLIETGDKFDGLSVNGVGFGGYAGYDFPVGERMFLGLQMGIESSSSEFTASDGFSRIKLEAGRSFDIGGRAGVMVNDATALYGRLAWGQTNFKASVDDESDDRDLSAWRLGGGLETRLNEQVGLRVEYLYSAYEDEAGLEPSGSQFRAGLNWRF
ncbi:hypothetical protein HYN04_07640 [Phenylobacterium parvum]|uniref:Outer membrane protein beta-barrel domain-containing protein n=2 Tax=Phenylobacterium parvum TaxID=2201350 RepID=A0A2Z3HW78_9CAUL|nr:hypothetical protein HYN04_07640 [Phenylobacterium parvum]